MDAWLWMVLLVSIVIGGVLIPLSMRRRRPYVLGVDLTSSARTEVDRLLAEDKQIEAIKVVRADTSWSLVQAKEYVDGLRRGETPPTPLPEPARQLPPDVVEEVWLLTSRNQHVDVVKVVREHTGWPLAEANSYVRQFRAR